MGHDILCDFARTTNGIKNIFKKEKAQEILKNDRIEAVKLVTEADGGVQSARADEE